MQASSQPSFSIVEVGLEKNSEGMHSRFVDISYGEKLLFAPHHQTSATKRLGNYLSGTEGICSLSRQLFYSTSGFSKVVLGRGDSEQIMSKFYCRIGFSCGPESAHPESRGQSKRMSRIGAGT
jgi:hypothetical protein